MIAWAESRLGRKGWVRFNSWLAALWYRRHMNVEKRYSKKKKKGSKVRIFQYMVYSGSHLTSRQAVPDCEIGRGRRTSG